MTFVAIGALRVRLDFSMEANKNSLKQSNLGAYLFAILATKLHRQKREQMTIGSSEEKV